MKNASDTGFSLGCLAIVSLFVGIILVAVAAGAIWPGIDQFAAGRFVCSNGHLVIQQDTYSYRPGSTDTMTTDLCVDRVTGAQTDVSFPTMAVSGLVYSAAIFMLGLILPAIGKVVGKVKAASAA